MPAKIADMLDGLELFQGFQFRELETVARYLSLEAFDKNDILFKEGDPGNYMMILVDGRVGVFKDTDNGRQLLLREGKGRIIGEMALLDHEPRSATCIAETDVEVVTFTQANLLKLATEQPAVAYHFMLSLARLLSRRLRRTSGIMADFLGQ